MSSTRRRHEAIYRSEFRLPLDTCEWVPGSDVGIDEDSSEVQQFAPPLENFIPINSSCQLERDSDPVEDLSAVDASQAESEANVPRDVEEVNYDFSVQDIDRCALITDSLRPAETDGESFNNEFSGIVYGIICHTRALRRSSDL